MSYDINLKKTQLGYQFDRNVYIGYQTNDNRVVTVKELKGLNVSGGGGGGGGGIQSITLGGGDGEVRLTVDGTQQTATVTNVVADETSVIPQDAEICVIAEDDNGVYTVYPSGHTWADIPRLDFTGNNVLINVGTGATAKQLTLGSGLTKSSSGNTLTLSLGTNVITGLRVSNQQLQYQTGGGATWNTLAGIGNVYAQSGSDDGPIISNNSTQFIFVEVN